jgi:hypothetical protein
VVSRIARGYKRFSSLSRNSIAYDPAYHNLRLIQCLTGLHVSLYIHETQDSADAAKPPPHTRLRPAETETYEGPNHVRPETPAKDDLSRVRLLLPTTSLMIGPTVTSFLCPLYPDSMRKITYMACRPFERMVFLLLSSRKILSHFIL